MNAIKSLIEKHKATWNQYLPLVNYDPKGVNKVQAETMFDEAYDYLEQAFGAPPEQVGIAGVAALLNFAVDEAEDDGSNDVGDAGMRALGLATAALMLMVEGRREMAVVAA